MIQARLPFVFPLLLIASAAAQTPCEGVAAWSPCELAFDLPPGAAATFEVQAEFRSPRFKTYLMPAFWTGKQLLIRFTPTEPGEWIYRLSGNVASLEGKTGAFHAGESPAPGFIHVANVHHWVTDDRKAHLWMGCIADRLGFEPAADAEPRIAEIAAGKCNHIRLSILGGAADRARVWLKDGPNPAHFDALDRTLTAIHKRGLTADLLLAGDPDYWNSLAPDWQSRERLIRYLVARYAPLNITWLGLERWEDYKDSRELLKQIGLALKKLDPYQHPRSSAAGITSSPLLADGWMDFIVEGSIDHQVAAVEHQFYAVPFIEVTDAQHLWNATMDGAYPELLPGGEAIAKSWFDVLADTRHWELEPYFDLDGGRATALEDVEYLVYIEKPAGPIEVSVEKHGYDIYWFNPLTGVFLEQKKYKGEHYTGEAPDRSHPWVLLIAREGRKESMLKSYKFESRPVPVQEIETNAQKVPFEILDPAGDTLVARLPVKYMAKVKRETRATRSILYLWTAEAPVDGQGLRVLGTGPQGTFSIPVGIALRYPAVLTIHVSALNANGKAYAADKVYQLNR
ncbi:MAG: DUF5060 domain-containing protein [Acidobacteriota bacterium]|nr:DUF5060 domain-containing protein [Acidobacteriota bacterium]